VTDTNSNKYVSGGKMWNPEPQKPKVIVKKNAVWEVISLTWLAASIAFMILIVMNSLAAHLGADFGDYVPKWSSDLEVKFKPSSFTLFYVFSVLVFIFTVLAIIARMKAKGSRIIQPRFSKTLQKIAGVSSVLTLVLGVIWGCSALLPKDDTIFRDKTTSSIENWMTERDIEMSHTNAVKLMSFAWGQKPNADKQFPKDSKPYILSLKAGGEMKDFKIYKFNNNDILFSVEK